MQGKPGPLDTKITIKEISTMIKLLKLGKSKFGPVSDEILKCNPKEILPTLCIMFNFVLESQIFPNSWNLSLIKQLYKYGPKTKHSNYRGICISSHLSKLFTCVLNKRLEKWVEFNKILPDRSFGFRKGLKTEDGLFVFSTILDKYGKRDKRFTPVLLIVKSLMIPFHMIFYL